MAITFGQHHQHTNIVADGQQQPWTVAVPVANGESAAAATAAMMMGDYFEENGKLRKARGLSWAVAAFFVVADMAGGGIVALPTAVVRCQFYPGLFLLLFMAFISIFSAMKLSKCWEILLRRFPTYRTHCRKPYAEIGFRALGPKMKTIVSICVNIDMFGSSTIFLLLCTKNIRDFLQAFYRLDISFCWLILVIALFLWPITLLKSPKDFWPVIVGGMLSTGFAIILVCLGALLDYGTCQPVREFPEFSAVNYLYALGTMLFTYGGQSTFPTIQHDMKKPAQFAKSVVLGYIMISVFNFLAVSIGGFVYGNSLRDSVINSVQIVWIQQMINLMITAHCLLTLSLIINPLDQEIEELVGIPQHFGWKRVLVRSAVLATIVFVAETVPSFGPVLDFFGGSAMALNSFVFPSVFYLFLAAGEQKAKEKEHYVCVEPPTFREMVQRTKKRTLILCGVVIVLSTLAGFIATFFASRAMISSEFTTPCYLRTFFPESGSQMNTTITTTTATNCCGPYQNVSRYGPSQQQCAKMDLNFF